MRLSWHGGELVFPPISWCRTAVKVNLDLPDLKARRDLVALAVSRAFPALPVLMVSPVIPVLSCPTHSRNPMRMARTRCGSTPMAEWLARRMLVLTP
jgi:hypothetical protein